MRNVRQLLLGFLISTLCVACSKREAAPQTADSETTEGFQTPEKPSPPAVVELANAYLASLPPEQQPEDLERARADFVDCFFNGFTNHTGSMGTDNTVRQQAFKAGQEFRRANPAKIRETFESFGYTATESVGIWSAGFERSGFTPRDHKDEEWWLWASPDSISDGVLAQEIPEQGLAVRLIGYLSPKGSYGHLGSYEREFYATSISPADQ